MNKKQTTSLQEQTTINSDFTETPLLLKKKKERNDVGSSPLPAPSGSEKYFLSQLH